MAHSDRDGEWGNGLVLRGNGGLDGARDLKMVNKTRITVSI